MSEYAKVEIWLKEVLAECLEALHFSIKDPRFYLIGTLVKASVAPSEERR